MPVKIIQSTSSAYAYPLLIKQLLHTPLATAPDQEITYQGKLRYSYRTLNERIGRLANGLTSLGVEAGQVAGVGVPVGDAVLHIKEQHEVVAVGESHYCFSSLDSVLSDLLKKAWRWW